MPCAHAKAAKDYSLPLLINRPGSVKFETLNREHIVQSGEERATSITDGIAIWDAARHGCGVFR